MGVAEYTLASVGTDYLMSGNTAESHLTEKQQQIKELGASREDAGRNADFIANQVIICHTENKSFQRFRDLPCLKAETYKASVDDLISRKTAQKTHCEIKTFIRCRHELQPLGGTPWDKPIM